MATRKSRPKILVESSESSSNDENSIRFPLPDHVDSSLCRDEFLRTILKQDEHVEEEFEVAYRESDTPSFPMTGEALAVLKLLHRQQEQKNISTISQYRLSLSGAELELLYKMCLVQTQKGSMRFLFVRLRKQINTLLRIWPGEVDPIPHKLFNWSKEHFMRRLQIDQTYLEVLVMERTKADLDCVKFCIDLQEVIMFIEMLMLDFINDLDICETSRLLDELNYEANPDWVRDVEALRLEHKRLDSIVRLYENVSDSQPNTAEAVAEYDKTEALMMIELRYRMNWLHSCGEQHLMWLQAKEKQYEDEISELQEKNSHDTTILGHTHFVYQYQIDNYRMSIDAWQQQLDSDLETAELKCNTTQSHLVKARDDLKFYQEQTVMFKSRVEEVLKLIEKEETCEEAVPEKTAIGPLQKKAKKKKKKK